MASPTTSSEAERALKVEVEGLEEVTRQLFLELHDLRNHQERIVYSKTFKGKYFNALGYFFSLYCMWKIFISTINIVFDRVGRVDPITRGFEIAVNYLGFQFDVQFWAQQISFIIVGEWVGKRNDENRGLRRWIDYRYLATFTWSSAALARALECTSLTALRLSQDSIKSISIGIGIGNRHRFHALKILVDHLYMI